MIYLANDHAGYDLANDLVKYFKEEDITFEHVSAGEYDGKDSYVEQTILGSKKVVENAGSVGIFICGTGIGTSIVANRNKKVRAALCHSVEFAKLARMHNHANVLVLPGRFMDIELGKEVVNTFLNTKFEGGRHKDRVDSIDVLC